MPSLKRRGHDYVTDDFLLILLSQLPSLLLHVDVGPPLGLLDNLQTRFPGLLFLEQSPGPLHSVESSLGSLEVAWEKSNKTIEIL